MLEAASAKKDHNVQPNSDLSARRKKRNRHEEHEHPHVHDESNWLVSYADMMTLLFGFFVLMYSFSKIDTEKFEVVRKDISKYFGGTFKENPGAMDVQNKIKSEMAMGTEDEQKRFSVATSGSNVKITFESELLFKSGSADLTVESVKLVDKIGKILKSQKIQALEVEGHTDSDPIQSVYFPSNWELSAARAARIVRRFAEHQIPENLMRASGLADSQLKYPEKEVQETEILENKKKNRRVIINVALAPNQESSLQSLKDQGFNTPAIKANTSDEDVAAAAASQEGPLPEDPHERMLEVQRRIENAQKRLEQANQKMQFAKDYEKKMKELEKISKKAESLEQKIQTTEKKAEHLLDSSSENPRLPANNESPK